MDNAPHRANAVTRAAGPTGTTKGTPARRCSRHSQQTLERSSLVPVARPRGITLHCTAPHDTLAVVSLVRCTLQGNRWPLTRCSYSPTATGPTLQRYSSLPVGHTLHGSHWPCTDLFRQQSRSIRTCSSTISEWCSCCCLILQSAGRSSEYFLNVNR